MVQTTRNFLRGLMLLAGLAAMAAQAQQQPQVTVETQRSQQQAQAPQGQIVITEERWMALSEQPELALDAARDSIMRRDFDAAARHLRAAAAFVDTEGERASGKTAESLRNAGRHLTELADRAERDDLRGLSELNQAATEVHRALAAEAHDLAQKAHEARDDRRAGHYLQAAARHLEHGIAWSGHAIERGTADTLDAVRDGAGKLVAGTGWTAAKGGELISGLGQEIERAGRWMEPRGEEQTAEAPSVTPPPQRMPGV